MMSATDRERLSLEEEVDKRRRGGPPSQRAAKRRQVHGCSDVADVRAWQQFLVVSSGVNAGKTFLWHRLRLATTPVMNPRHTGTYVWKKTSKQQHQEQAKSTKEQVDAEHKAPQKHELKIGFVGIC